MKRDVFGTPAHFAQLMGRQSQVPQQQQEERKGGERLSSRSSMHGTSEPNVIGNLEDPATTPLHFQRVSEVPTASRPAQPKPEQH